MHNKKNIIKENKHFFEVDYGFLGLIIPILMAITVGVLLLPSVDNIMGLRLLLGVEQLPVGLNVIFVWFYRFVIFSLIIISMLTLLVRKVILVFIAILTSATSVFFVILMIWQINTVNKSSLTMVFHTVGGGVYLLLIVAVIFMSIWAKIIFS